MCIIFEVFLPFLTIYFCSGLHTEISRKRQPTVYSALACANGALTVQSVADFSVSFLRRWNKEVTKLHAHHPTKIQIQNGPMRTVLGICECCILVFVLIKFGACRYLEKYKLFNKSVEDIFYPVFYIKLLQDNLPYYMNVIYNCIIT